MRGASSASACGVSPAGKKVLPTCWPVVWLKGWFAPLFSGDGRARTHRAHWAPEGSAAPGGSVPKKAGAAGAAGEAVGVARGEGDVVPLRNAPGESPVREAAGSGLGVFGADTASVLPVGFVPALAKRTTVMVPAVTITSVAAIRPAE